MPSTVSGFLDIPENKTDKDLWPGGADGMGQFIQSVG